MTEVWQHSSAFSQVLSCFLLCREGCESGEDPGGQGGLQRTFPGRCLQRERLDIYFGRKGLLKGP